MFYKKISTILNSNEYPIIVKDTFLIWHFLHNQNNGSKFHQIMEHLMPAIIDDVENHGTETDGSNKWKLLQYVDLYGGRNSDEVVSILSDMLATARSTRLKRRIAMSIEHIQKPVDPNELFKLANNLLDESDPMVREFLVRGLYEHIDTFTPEQNKQLVKKMFASAVEMKDVTQSSLSLSLEFRGDDLSNAAFSSMAKYLGGLVQSPLYADGIIEEFMTILDGFAKSEASEDDKRKIKHLSVRKLDKSDLIQKDWEYEHDPVTRLLLELWNGLNTLEEKDVVVFEDVCAKIIEKAEYSAYFEVLVNVLEDNYDFEELRWDTISTPGLLSVVELLHTKWNQFISSYLMNHPEKVNDYIELVDKSDLDVHGKIFAYYAIPKNKQNDEIMALIRSYEKERGYEVKVYNNDILESESKQRRNKAPDLEFLDQDRTDEELLTKFNEYKDSKNEFIFRHETEIFRKFSEYFTRHPEQLKKFYEGVKGRFPDGNINRLPGSLCGGQVKHFSDQYEPEGNQTAYYEKMRELYGLFHDDVGAKLAIGRSLNENERLRNKETGELKKSDENLFNLVKKLVLALCNDSNPSEEHENSSFGVGLNTVRGLGATLICVLAHYYPSDADLLAKIEQLSKDPIKGIQATLIINLVYLISKDYEFCDRIIMQFENVRSEPTDLALVKYIYRIGNDSINEKKELIRKIAQNPEEEVRSEIGGLLAQAVVHGAEVDDLIEEMIHGKLGDKFMVETFAHTFEHEFKKALMRNDKENIEKIILTYNNLLTNYVGDGDQERAKVAEKLSYLFFNDDLPTDAFDLLLRAGILANIIDYGPFQARRNVNSYLFECLKGDLKLKETVLSLLKKEIDKQELFLSDSFYSAGVADIIKHLLENSKRSELLDEIFDKGLMYGTDKFYEIFDEYYRDIKE